MKLLIVLFLVSTVALSQSGTIKIGKQSNSSDLFGTLFSRSISEKDYADTTKCKMLVSIDKTVMIMIGYSVHRVGQGYAGFYYLDIDKKKLPKEVEVWISKEVE